MRAGLGAGRGRARGAPERDRGARLRRARRAGRHPRRAGPGHALRPASPGRGRSGADRAARSRSRVSSGIMRAQFGNSFADSGNKEDRPMALPSHVKYLVIGAGVHGLSTAWHLAKEQRAARRGAGRADRRQDRRRRGRLGHRLRRRPQQLLPAGHVRADGRQRRGVGAGSGGLQLPPGRLLRPRRRAPGRRPDRGARAPAAHRLPVRADRRRRERAPAHAGDVPRLAGAGRRGVPARAQGRLRQQHGLHAGPRRQGDARPAPGWSTACA